MRLFISALPLELGAVGISSYTRDLFAAIENSQIADKTTILCPPWLDDHPSITSSEIRVNILNKFRKWPSFMRSILWQEYLGLHLQRRKDYIFHSPGFFSSVCMPRNCVITCHDLIPIRFPVYLGKNPLRKWIFQRNLESLKRCNAILADSVASKDDIIRYTSIPPHKVTVMYCWLNEEFSEKNAKSQAPKIKAKYNLPDQYWLYLGGYDIRKNIPFLVETYLRAVKDGIPCPPLVLVGRLPTRKIPALCDMQSVLEKAHIQGAKIICPGFFPQEDLPGLYGGAELFIYPSLFEGFGLPPLEAMGCGCPAIVADNSSLKEVVSDASYRFSTESPDDLFHLFKKASHQKLPLNPSFSRSSFSLSRSFEIYLKTIQKLQSTH